MSTDPKTRLRAARESRGLSLRKAAELTDIPVSSWQTAEEGSLPNARRAVVMARALGSTVEEIWGDALLPDDAADTEAPRCLLSETAPASESGA